MLWVHGKPKPAPICAQLLQTHISSLRYSRLRVVYRNHWAVCLEPEALKGFQVGLPRFLDSSSQIGSLPHARTFADRVSMGGYRLQ